MWLQQNKLTEWMQCKGFKLKWLLVRLMAFFFQIKRYLLTTLSSLVLNFEVWSRLESSLGYLSPSGRVDWSHQTRMFTVILLFKFFPTWDSNSNWWLAFMQKAKHTCLRSAHSYKVWCCGASTVCKHWTKSFKKKNVSESSTSYISQKWKGRTHKCW